MLLLKIGVTGLLIAFFINTIDCQAIERIIQNERGWQALLLSTCLLMMQTVIAGIRLAVLLRLLGRSITWLHSIKFNFMANFCNHLFFSFIGGDAVKIGCLTKQGMPLMVATQATILDRFIGFIVLNFLLIIILPFFIALHPTRAMQNSLYILLGANFAIIVFFLTVGFLPDCIKRIKWIRTIADVCSNMHFFLANYKLSFLALILSFFIQLLNALVLYSIFLLYKSNVSLWWCIVLSTPALLIAMLPISFAGWGVRETALVMSFSLLKLPVDTILATSITFGIAIFCASLPGCFWLFYKKSFFL